MLVHKTVTLHVNVLYKRREGAKSEPPLSPYLVPCLSPLNKVSVDSACPRGVSWAGSASASPRSPVFSAASGRGGAS